MDLSKLVKTLELASEGVLSSHLVAATLNISYGEAEAIVGALLAHGYLRRIKAYSCASCPLANRCASAVNERCGVELYEVTEKGRTLLSKSREKILERP